MDVQKLDEKARSACGIIMLSGTAIKNRAEEYFVPLNIVAPERFPSLERFRCDWLNRVKRGNGAGESTSVMMLLRSLSAHTCYDVKKRMFLQTFHS